MHKLFKQIPTQFVLVIIPMVALFIGVGIGYTINKLEVKKLKTELAQKQKVIFDLEKNCHGHEDH
jgi:uncharacterized membrane-anchored protein YhcB (DUF1043 family)